jgi:soluble lytic murein transglycosylase-like protein
MLYQCILYYSLLAGVDPTVTETVIKMESNGNPNVIGTKGDTGLMQIRYQYVPETQKQLLNPCINIRRGTQLLRQAMNKCAHKTKNQWLICYNAGIAGGNKIRFPDLHPYWLKFTRIYKNDSAKWKRNQAYNISRQVVPGVEDRYPRN